MKPIHVLAAATTLLSACATAPSPDAGTPDAFGPCPVEAGHPELADSVCSVQTVALDPDAPDGETIDLFVRKFPARTERAGEVWMLAGGPGEAGTSFYTKIADFRARFPGYDVLIPDHRGTGRSSRLCAGETLQSEAGTALAGAEFGPCFGEVWAQADRTTQFSMTHAARDLDTLMDRLGGDGERWVYAVSYGTGLALRFGQLHDAPVDGLILDSLVPAARARIPDMIDIAIHRPEALEAFHADAVVPAFDALSAVSDYEASAFSITLAGLIGVSETNRRPEMTAEAVAAEEAGLWFTSPLTQLQTRTSMPAYPRDEWFDAPYADMPPILVVHGTLDPKTTLEGARRHIAALEAGGTDVTVTIVERAPHASWFFAPDCLHDAMEDFMGGEAVAERCRPAPVQ